MVPLAKHIVYDCMCDQLFAHAVLQCCKVLPMLSTVCLSILKLNEL